jgi:hypothetical protein
VESQRRFDLTTFRLYQATLRFARPIIEAIFLQNHRLLGASGAAIFRNTEQAALNAGMRRGLYRVG